MSCFMEDEALRSMGVAQGPIQKHLKVPFHQTLVELLPWGTELSSHPRCLPFSNSQHLVT